MPKTAPPPQTHLAARLSAVEASVRRLTADMAALAQDVKAVSAAEKATDSRTQRGDALMLEIQGEQRRMARTLARIAQRLNVDVEATNPGEG